MCAEVGTYSKMRYLEQYDRILRWRDSLNNKNINHEVYKDNLLAFFINCWNLKDWLERDPTIIFEDIKDDIYKSQNIKLCQSIANASKHLSLTNDKITPVNIYQELNIPVNGNNPCTKESILLTSQDTKGGYTEECVAGNLDCNKLDMASLDIKYYSFYINDDNGFSIDALELADNCISDWKNILGIKE